MNKQSNTNRAFEDEPSSSKARFNTDKESCVGADSGNVSGIYFRNRENGKGFNMKQEQVLEKVDTALSELEESLARGESKSLKNYLRFLGQFHNYSFGNLILIYCQLPTASFVAGYRKWQALGRQVRKGEKSIRILAPLVRKKDSEQEANEEAKNSVFGFRSVGVFDISQTEGEELPSLSSYEGDPGENLRRLERFVEEKNIELSWVAPNCGALGVSMGGKIEVDPSLDLPIRFSSLAHEVAHELLHRSDHRKETTKSLRETEAEAVAFAICSAIGLETNDSAADYIQLHQGDVEKLKASLDLIRDAASEILSAMSVKEPKTVEAALVG